MLLSLLITWLLYFGVLYVVTDSAQRFLYDQVVEGLWWRSLAGSLPLTLLAVKFPSRFDDMFVSEIHLTILSAVAWFLVFWLMCRYQASHAAVVGVVTFLLVATLGGQLVMSLSTVAGPANAPAAAP